MKTPLPLLDRAGWLAALDRARRPYHARYHAMYSSLWKGIVTDPVLMQIPVDDHVAHRGDGVFESLKCVNGCLYNLGAHLERLLLSARALHLDPPGDRAGLSRMIIETVRAGGREQCVVRVLLARGPGGMGANPYESPESQVYIVVYELGESFMTKHPAGARIGLSDIPPKTPFHARVKSCNYLPNVLMAREAADRHLDFVVACDEQGFLTECATENIMLVTADGHLATPGNDRILAGTTLQRGIDLAGAIRREGLPREVVRCSLRPEDARAAREILIVGTTRDVIAATAFEEAPVGDGTPGPVYHELSRLLENDILRNEGLLTRVF